MAIRKLRRWGQIGIVIFLSGSLLYCSSSSNWRPDPQVVVGGDFLQKEKFFEEALQGTVTSITVGRRDSDPRAEITVAGEYGAAFVTRDGALRSSRTFGGRGQTLVPIDLENDGICEFMNRGGGWQAVSLYTHLGRLLWKYNPSERPPNNMAAGDLDGDGNLAFVVGTDGREGLHRLDLT